MKRKIREILEKKGNAVWTISSDATVYEALQIMAEKNVGALVAVENGDPVGVLSEREYARKVILRGASSLSTPVKQIMTRSSPFVSPEATVEECMALVTSQRCRHLPVIQAGKLAGLVSIGDLVKVSIEERDFMIGQLENYIMGA